MKQWAFIIVLLSTSVFYKAGGQNFIGLHEEKIKAVMKESYANFYLNTTTVNKHFNYLKYENDEGTQTLLIFLDENDSCKYFKRIYDYLHLPDLTIQLKKSSKRKNDTLWILKNGNETYDQIIQKGEWFFTVTTRKHDE